MDANGEKTGIERRWRTARQRLGLRQSSAALERRRTSKAPEDWRSLKPRGESGGSGIRVHWRSLAVQV